MDDQEFTRPYPDATECDKSIECTDESMVLSNFFDWLVDDKGFAICSLCPSGLYGADGEIDQWMPIRINPEELFADYFGIDLKLREKERKDILKWIREQQEEKHSDKPEPEVIFTVEGLDGK